MAIKTFFFVSSQDAFITAHDRRDKVYRARTALESLRQQLHGISSSGLPGSALLIPAAGLQRRTGSGY
jgi:hypothetical protein